MRHARPQDLDPLEPLLERLRATGLMVEKTRGVFYLKSKAFLHFHQDPAGMFADVRAADLSDFERMQVDAPASWDELVAKVRARAGKSAPKP